MTTIAEAYLYQTQEQQYSKDAHSQLDHVCQLDIDRKPAYIRQTNIICTIGDSSDTEDKLRELIENGMNIARLNLTLGSFSYYSKIIQMIRRLEKEMKNACVAIAVDLVAPTVRTGLVNNDVMAEVELKEGQQIELTIDDKYKNDCNSENIWVDSTYFRNVIPAMKTGDRIFIDDGAIIVIVRETGLESARCLVEQGGRLGSSKRCILPRNALFKHAFSVSFRQNLLFALENQVDMIFSSFIDSRSDVLRIKEVIGPVGRGIKIVAKIETKNGIVHLDEIVEEADAIMIGRGDLGLELPIEKVFVAQKSIIARCQMAKKPVMVVTQMLESMRYKPRATRAEISDVANAVLDGADGLVLSVETARGMYPVETLQTMHRVCREAESAMFHRQLFLDLKIHEASSHMIDPTKTTAIAAVEASSKAKASCIIVVTTSGRSASLIASYRPQCPVITVTRQVQVARQCHLWRGLHPLVYTEYKADDWSEDMDLRINYAIEWGCSRGFLKPGDPVIIVTGWIAGTGSTNTVRVFYVPEKKTTELHVVRSIQRLIDLGDEKAMAVVQDMASLDRTESNTHLGVFDKSNLLYD